MRAIGACCSSSVDPNVRSGGSRGRQTQRRADRLHADPIDIKAAKLALQKSKNKEVRDFAENMVRDHTAVNDQALALVKKLKVKPQHNGTRKALVKQADAKQA